MTIRMQNQSPSDLSIYRVKARNTSVDSENKIHDDSVAASYGFRGGLVPGITVYAYMTVPLVERFGFGWLERGSMQVKFYQPFYDTEEVVVTGHIDVVSDPAQISVSAKRSDGTVCASAVATIDDPSPSQDEIRIGEYPITRLPEFEFRPEASRDKFIPGATLGTIGETFDLPDAALLDLLDERLPIYVGERAVAHPFALLRLSNQILMSNFKLGPWIHAASHVINRSVVHGGEEVSVRGRVRECYERKGHEFVVLDVLLVAAGDRIVQQVRHTAIYHPRHI